MFSFRDTGNFSEKGVSLHECSGKRYFPFRDTGYFAENGVSRRVRGEEGRERKGSGSGWSGRAVECRMETACGLWHGSGAAEKGRLACAKAAGGEGQNQNKNKNRSQGNLKPVLICLRV